MKFIYLLSAFTLFFACAKIEPEPYAIDYKPITVNKIYANKDISVTTDGTLWVQGVNSYYSYKDGVIKEFPNTVSQWSMGINLYKSGMLCRNYETCAPVFTLIMNDSVSNYTSDIFDEKSAFSCGFTMVNLDSFVCIVPTFNDNAMGDFYLFDFKKWTMQPSEKYGDGTNSYQIYSRYNYIVQCDRFNNIMVYDAAHDKVQRFTFDFKYPNNPSETVSVGFTNYSIASNGDVYTFLFGTTLLKFNFATGNIETKNVQVPGLSSSPGIAAYLDDNDQLWYYGNDYNQNPSLFAYNTTTSQLISYVIPENGMFPAVLFVGSNNNLWHYYLDGSSNQLHLVHHRNGAFIENRTIAGYNVNYIKEDTQGDVWFGTTDEYWQKFHIICYRNNTYYDFSDVIEYPY